jgi:hypothetical protein
MWRHWRCNSNNTGPTLQAWSPEFKSQTHQKKERKPPNISTEIQKVLDRIIRKWNVSKMSLIIAMQGYSGKSYKIIFRYAKDLNKWKNRAMFMERKIII